MKEKKKQTLENTVIVLSSCFPVQFPYFFRICILSEKDNLAGILLLPINDILNSIFAVFSHVHEITLLGNYGTALTVSAS